MSKHTTRPTPPGLRSLSAIMLTVMALCAMTLSGCSDDGSGLDEVTPVVQNLLQLDGEENGSTRFLLYTPAATFPQVLNTTTRMQLAEDAFQGETYLVAYTAEGGEGAESAINVKAMARITNSNIQRGPMEDIEGWDSEPVWVTSIWRAGTKIDMRLLLAYDEMPRRFALMVDEATLGEEYPTAYLIHQRQTSSASFSRQYYASFQCKALWEQPGVKGLRIKVNNANDPSKNEFTVLRP